MSGWGKGSLGAPVRFWKLSKPMSERGSMAIMFDPSLVKGPDLWIVVMRLGNLCSNVVECLPSRLVLYNSYISL